MAVGYRLYTLGEVDANLDERSASGVTTWLHGSSISAQESNQCVVVMPALIQDLLETDPATLDFSAIPPLPMAE